MPHRLGHVGWCLFRGYTGSRDRLGARTVRVYSRAHEHAALRTLCGRQTRRRAPLSVAAGTDGAGAGCPAQARDVCHGSPELAASFLSLCALIWFTADMLNTLTVSTLAPSLPELLNGCHCEKQVANAPHGSAAGQVRDYVHRSSCSCSSIPLHNVHQARHTHLPVSVHQ